MIPNPSTAEEEVSATQICDAFLQLYTHGYSNIHTLSLLDESRLQEFKIPANCIPKILQVIRELHQRDISASPLVRNPGTQYSPGHSPAPSGRESLKRGSKKKMVRHEEKMDPRNAKIKIPFMNLESTPTKHKSGEEIQLQENKGKPVRKNLASSYQSRSDPNPKGVPYEGNFLLNFLLIRHGETEANADKKKYKDKSDHTTLLSKKGEDQAAEAAKAIVKFFQTKYKCSEPPEDFRCTIWTSSYKRARDTSEIIKRNSNNWITEIRHSIYLVEQQFGLFEGVDWASGEVNQLFPRELTLYTKCSDFGGRFWASVPMGESRFEVCQRVCQTFEPIYEHAKITKEKFTIIVSHGVTLRAFMMMYFGYTPEWFEECPNPTNCSIRLIENKEDKGYIWQPEHQDTEEQKDLLLTKI